MSKRIEDMKNFFESKRTVIGANSSPTKPKDEKKV